MFKGGYLGKILRINLTDKTFKEVPLDEEAARQLLGGRGMAAKIYYDEISPDIDPFSPDNKVIFMTGPLTGVRLPSTTKFQLATKSPLTGIYLCSNSSGFFGPQLKRCGYDGLIIEGQADSWTYISIKDNQVEFHDAFYLLGKTNTETQKAMKDTFREKTAAALSIGPAGEKLVRLAYINVDTRAFGRGGPGAVFGSKKLKGIVIKGTGVIPVAAPEEVNKIRKRAIEILKESTIPLQKYGTPNYVEILNEIGIVPTRNYQTTFFEDVDKVDGNEMLANYTEKKYACYMCSIACGKINAVKNGPYKGARARTEYETIVLLGPNLGINNFGAIIKAAELCDELGIKGLISKDDTSGIEAKFGNAEAVFSLIKMIAEKNGIGSILGEGMRIVAEKKPEWKDYIIAVKGLPLAGYDPRGFYGKCLTYGTSSRGACHNVGGWTVRAELLSEQYDRYALKGKGKLVKSIQDNRAYVDSLGICTMARKGMGYTDNPQGHVLEKVTGYNFTSRLMEIGSRIYNLERLIIVREGIRRKDDLLPKRMSEPVQTGPIKGQKVTPEMYNIMLNEYYKERGWDKEGIPQKDTIKKMGLNKLL